MYYYMMWEKETRHCLNKYDFAEYLNYKLNRNCSAHVTIVEFLIKILYCFEIRNLTTFDTAQYFYEENFYDFVI